MTKWSLVKRPRLEAAEYALAVGSDDEVVGKVCRVIGAIEAGKMGEVMIPIRGGSEAYFAYASSPDDVISRGERVIVLEHDPPRTVVVSRYP